jgi:hypothetical protein
MSKNSKTAIAEIKKLMKQFGFLAEETPLMSFKLEDNTILQAEKLEAGQSINKINDAFESVVLEDGSYRLVENFSIEVKDGKIESVKEIFVDAKLIDGTVVKVEGDSVVEGAKVVVVTEQGELPAPDGVHELEDGSKIETKDGAIVMVSPVEVEDLEYPKDEKDVASGPDANEMPPVGGEKVDVEMMDLLKEFIKKMSEKMNAMEAKLSSVQSEFNSFKKEPAGKKISDGKKEFNKQEISNDIDARIATIMSMRKLNK